MTRIIWPRLSGFPPESLPNRIDAITPGRGTWSGPGERRSAVCLLFIPPADDKDPAQILFIRRSTKVNSHRGQIGLAGGRAEYEDQSPADTAFRELQEELGIVPARLAIAGILPPVQTLDGQPVVPVVCCATIQLVDVVQALDEVAYVFAEPWTSFVNVRNSPFCFNIFGNWRRSELFLAVDGREKIWGLTALILHRANLS